MKELQTQFGTLFIEELDQREEKERIKIYDSDQRYLAYASTAYFDYLISECQCSEEASYQLFVNSIVLEDDLDFLLYDILDIEYEHYGDINSLKEYFLEADIYDWVTKETTIAELLDNDLINRIGDTLILISDYHVR